MSAESTTFTTAANGFNLDRIGLAVLTLALVAAPLVLSSAYELNVLVLMIVNAILATGLAIVVRAGRLSLAQASFGGIGGYTTGYLTTQLGLGFWQALPAAAAAAALIGLMLGLISMRLRGFYFAIATFTFSQLLIVILRAWTPVTGGMGGMFGLPHPSPLLGLDFGNPRNYYYLTLAMLLIAVLIYRACTVSTSFGRGVAVLGEDEVLATTLGVPATRYRLAAFGISSAIGGIGGAFGAHFIQGVSPSDIAPVVSVFIVVMVLAGGTRTLVGPILGAILMTTVPELLRASAQLSMVFYGAFLLVYVYLFREGLLPLARATLLRALHRQGVSVAATHAARLMDAANGSAGPDRALAKMGDMPIIALDKATCRFGALTVLDGIDWSVTNGCINGLIGPNGAGKTTFFNMLTGIAPCVAGHVLWNGKPVQPVPGQMVRRGLGRTYQSARVFENHTVAESVLLAAELSRRPVSHNHLRWLLDTLGLRPVMMLRGRELTHYQRRLTSIAMAMASNPEFVLLDEPLAGLDDTESGQLARTIAKLQAETGNTILLIEHKLSALMDLCSTLTVLDHGQIISHGAPKDVSRDPDVIKAYLGHD